MSNRHPSAGVLLAGIAYLCVIGSLFTGVYHALTLAQDRSWLILVTKLAVFFGRTPALVGWLGQYGEWSGINGELAARAAAGHTS